MRSYNKYLIAAVLLIFIFSIGSASASDFENTTLNHISPDNGTVVLSENSDNVIGDTLDEITVDNWDDLQEYCSKSDKNYVLKLKENTNYYPTDLKDSSYQIQVNNNVTILGSSGAYFGDSSPDARSISYLAINVPENSGFGITLKNITFKWISTSFMPDAVFLQMAGNANNIIENCDFLNCTLTGGHSSLVYLLRGDVTLNNCSFKNILSDFGCVSLYDPKDNPMDVCTNARGEISNCYFEGNYARTEPGCINNCGVLTVTNSTFYRNTASRWAGAIHTHGGANTTIYDSNFTDNLAGWNGGALYTYSYLQIYNTIFIGNNCTTNNGGGAIGASKYLHCPYIHIEDSLFEDNENLCWGLDELSTTGTGRGGAISLMDEGALTVLNTTFIKNSASIGTAICAIAQGQYGSPDVTIIGNRFINHTRVGDVLNIKLNYNSDCEIRDNYYLANSIEFAKLKLIADERVGDEVTLHVDVALKNPDFYDSDILEKSGYDVYMDGQYLKTVNSKDFTINLKNIEKAQVYVVPSISISKSSEVSVGMPIEYMYLSQKSGNDNNNGSKNAPVKTFAKAIELANATGNIIVMDGTFSEKNLEINYDLTIAGEDNVVVSSKGNVFNVGNVELSLKNITFKNSKQASSSSERIIKQSGGFLNLEDCTFESNSYNTLIESSASIEANNLKFIKNNAILILADDYKITSSVFDSNVANTKTKMSTLIKSNNGQKAFISDVRFSNNTVIDGCVYFYAKSTQNILTVTDSAFIGNSANEGCSCILMPYSGGLLDVKSSLFINNTDSSRTGALILTSTEVHVTDSIFLQNTIANSNNALINAKSSANLKNIYCDGNWFGNTQENYNISPQISSSSKCSYWLYLNASANTTKMFIGENAKVSFDLNNIYNKNGEASYWDSSKLPTVDLSISTVGGKSSESYVTLIYGMANTIYTLNEVEGKLIASYNGFEDVINFTKARLDPKMEVTFNNISVDDDEIIAVALIDDATGNLTLTFGNTTRTQDITNPKTTFTLSDLSAGDYTAVITYSGNKFYESAEKSIQFSVNKYNSTTAVSAGQIEVGRDVTLTINVSPSVTGNITLIINNKEETLTLVNSKANYTINSITRGDYDIKVLYNGNYKYLTSQDSIKFSVDKLNTTIAVNVEDIVYGQNAIIEVVLDDDATGNVTIAMNNENTTSEIINGKSLFNISKLNVGNKELFVYYGGNNVFNAINYTTSFNVLKASTTLTINANDIMIGHDENIEVIVENGVDGNITITCAGQSIVKTIPRTGKVSWKLSNLPVEKYVISAILISDNYFNVENTTEFNVLDYETPLWPNQGYDIQNTGKSPYDTDSNGAILWSYNVSGEITGNLAIDCNGNIYLATSTAVYALNNAVQLWNYTQKFDGSFYGVAIGRDVIIVPENGNTIHFINQTTGEKFGRSNIYQGSSLFAPVIDSNANIYISSEYQVSSSDYKLVIIPYSLWENGGNPTIISLGKSQPVSSPVIVSESTAVVSCDDGLKIIDLDNKQVMSSIPGKNNGIRPVMGPGNMIYAVLDDNIVEITPDGNQIWKTKITGGSGSYLALDDEWGLYSINSQGNLYRYDLIDGSESLISNLTFTSGILVGNDGNIYVGSNNMLYSFDSEGNVVWKSDMGLEIIGTPIIGNNGLIYVATNGSIAALSSAKLISPDITINVTDVSVGQDVTITVGINNQCIGDVIIKIDGKTYTDSINNQGIIVKTLSDLNVGIHTVEVYYNGDARFTGQSVSSNFTVKKSVTALNVSSEDIFVGENETISIIMPNDVLGNVSCVINGKNYSAKVNNGISNITISDLEAGKYAVTIKFESENYADCENITSFIVSKIKLSQDVLNVNGTIFAISLPSDAKGSLIVNVNDKAYTQEVIDGNAILSISDLHPGDYTASVMYSGDNKYESVIFNNVSLNIDKLPSEISVIAYNIYVGDVLTVNVTASVNSGKITLTLNNKTYDITIENAFATLTVSNLEAGSYAVVVQYSGDDTYNPCVNTTSFSVLKVDVPVTNDTVVIPESGDSSVYSISLPVDATGTFTVCVDGVNYTATLVNGKASVNVSDLSEGSHNVTVIYSGDGKYSAISKSAVVYVDKKDNGTAEKISSDLIIGVCDIFVGDVASVNVKVSENATGNITITVDNRDYSVVVDNGVVNLDISGLGVGEYVVVARYSGDDRFMGVQNSTVFSVLKVDVPVTNDTVVIPESGDSSVYSISLPVDATGTFTVCVDGVNYTATLVDGKASVNVSDLSEGSHNITVTYSGDAKYSPIVKSSVITIAPPVKLAGSNLSMLYTSGKYYKVRLTQGDLSLAGKKVKIIINSKTYTRTTDVNGYASVKISLPPKTYKAQAFYGDLKATNKVVVKSIISAKNINAKKSAKSIMIKVTLKKVNNKYLKNKKVTLKFNKKTFKARTNKKGVVTFTIKKNVYNKLKVGKKYSYQVTYVKSTVKKTIKLK